MDGLTVRHASDVSLGALTSAFNRAFEGYVVPMWHTPETMSAMLENNDVRLDASILLADEQGAFAGIALLAVRGKRGWVAGMGVARGLRGRHIGDELMVGLLNEARTLGLRSVQLEVLDQNTRARKLYADHGFRETRPLLVYTGPVKTADEKRGEGDGDAGRLRITQIEPLAALSVFDTSHAVAPPWQRERVSLEHMAPQLEGCCVYMGGAMRAYILAMALPNGISVLDCGSHSLNYEERAGDATVLIRHLIQGTSDGAVRAINVPPGDPLDAALSAMRCPVVAAQHEMLLAL